MYCFQVESPKSSRPTSRKKMDRVPTRRQDASRVKEPRNLSGFPVIGARVLDHYEIFEVNEGGFGYVVGVTDLSSGERIAIKIPKRGNGYTSSVEEFTKEVALWIDLAPHANIVTDSFVQEIHGYPVLF